MVKMGNLNKAPWWALFQINDIGYPDLLFEVKFNFVSQHLPDDSDELAGTVPKGIIMSPAFRKPSIMSTTNHKTPHCCRA